MSDIEHHLADKAARAGLRLRFDKVALRVTRSLQTSLRGFAPEGEAVLFTITAPISRPARTTAAIEALARNCPPGSRAKDTICGNDVRIRRIGGVANQVSSVLGFVHNPESDPEALLDLAEDHLTG